MCNNQELLWGLVKLVPAGCGFKEYKWMRMAVPIKPPWHPEFAWVLPWSFTSPGTSGLDLTVMLPECVCCRALLGILEL